MAEKIRVGVVGAGGNTRLHHIPKLKKIDGVEIVTVANRSRASSEKVAQEFGIPRVSENWQAVVNDPGVDAVVIGTWPYMHCPITLAALEAGKHVLTEARIAMNAAEARKMLAASREHPDLITQVVPGPPTFAADPTVMQLLADGYIGQLQSLDLHVGMGFPNSDAPMHWRMDRDFSEKSCRWDRSSRSRAGGRRLPLMARTRTAVATHGQGTRGAPRRTVHDNVEVLAIWQARSPACTGARRGLHAGQVWLFGSKARCAGAGGRRRNVLTAASAAKGDGAIEIAADKNMAARRGRINQRDPRPRAVRRTLDALNYRLYRSVKLEPQGRRVTCLAERLAYPPGRPLRPCGFPRSTISRRSGISRKARRFASHTCGCARAPPVCATLSGLCCA